LLASEAVMMVLADERVTDALSEGEIEALTDPSGYTGLAGAIAEQTVAASRHEGEKR
jgi:adenylosuccinate lyase